jgi:hypothetical protein
MPAVTVDYRIRPRLNRSGAYQAGRTARRNSRKEITSLDRLLSLHNASPSLWQ